MAGFLLSRPPRHWQITFQRTKSAGPFRHEPCRPAVWRPSLKNLFPKLALALSVAAAPMMLHAQAQDIAYGRLTINFDPTFIQNVQSIGISITDLNGNALVNNSLTMTSVGGSLDVTNGAGEVLHTGGIMLKIGSNVVRVENMVIDTTNSSTPEITGLYVINGKILGRIPVFTLSAPPGITVPLPVNAGTTSLNGIYINIAAATAMQLNTLIGGNAVPTGSNAGTETEYTVFVAPSIT